MAELRGLIEEINRYSREHWSKREEDFLALMSIPRFRRAAAEESERERDSGVPVAQQTMLEVLVEEAVLKRPQFALAVERACQVAAGEARDVAYAKADEAHAEVFRQRARKGGRAPKADPLTCDIRDLLRRDPRLTNEQFLERWKAREGEGLIRAVNEAERLLTYFDRNGNEATIPFANLRSRISRERKNLRRAISPSQASETVACTSASPVHLAAGDKEQHELSSSTFNGDLPFCIRP